MSVFDEIKTGLNEAIEYEKGNPTKVEKELCLTPEENEMFKFLKENNYRLEQEKIPFGYVLTKIPQ